MSLKRLMRVSRGINYNLSVSSHSHNIFANNCLVGNANKAVDKVKASKFYQFNSICVRSTTPAIFKNSHLPIGIEISSITYNSNKWLLSSRQYHRSLLAGSVITRSCPLMEKISMKVPSMGDSITEGTIMEWTVDNGQSVKEGDVIALIETDKVTIDIKAEKDGVVIKKFGAVDDTVAVGADLYQLDTEAAPSAVAASDAKTKEDLEGSGTERVHEAESNEATAQMTALPDTEKSGRKPSIKFLGKNGWARRLAGKTEDEVKPSEDEESLFVESIPDQGTEVKLAPDDPHWDPMYGRPALSEDEMEALHMGGASIAPRMIKPSSGAIFC